MQKRGGLAIDHLYAIRSGVSDVKTPPAIGDVCMIEADSCSRWQRHERGPDEAQAAATSFWHQA
jgi:hypothetical protein